MKLKAAFMFLSPDASHEKSVVSTPSVELTAIATRNYDDAVSVATELADLGIKSIELCGGFSHIGTARIANAVEGKATVGVVRFDIHPGLDGASGDSIFTK